MTHTSTPSLPLSPPRSVGEIRRQLADLSQVIQKARAYGIPDAASRLTLRSLEGQEQELLAELHAAEQLESARNGATKAIEAVQGVPLPPHRS